MSILIKGMSKPKTCDDCIVPLSKCDYLQKRADDCPLIEIDLVRCGECKYAKYKIEEAEYVKCMITQLFVSKSDFCSYGERRADDI